MSDKKEKKRDLILDTAFELILDKGYLNTKIIDIANKAGIGKGTVYEYFESKEALLLELIDKRVRRDYENVCGAAEKASGCKQKLSEYFRLEIETTSKYNANVTDLRSDFTNSNTEISAKITDSIYSIMLLQYEYVKGVIEKGIETGEFRKVDPYAATACFMGGISFYLHMLNLGLPCKKDSFLDCVFNGLFV